MGEKVLNHYVEIHLLVSSIPWHHSMRYHRYMPHTSHKNMPRIRRNAARLVFKGWSARMVGRHFGFHHTAVMKWVKEARKVGDAPIATRSSRPHSHPKELSKDVVQQIVDTRKSRNRYAEAIHQELRNKGVVVSLSSVKRTLDRNYLIKKKSPFNQLRSAEIFEIPQL